MKVLFNQIEDSIKYALSDRSAILIIGSLMAITSVISKNDSIDAVLRAVTITMIIVMGYGSFVSWYTINGQINILSLKTI